MKTLSLKLPDELATRISTVARQKRSNMSEVMRNALEAYLANVPTPHKGSVLDLAGDLVGALKGPEDLSNHDRHMRGYGE
jgi:hypothetical protein